MKNEKYDYLVKLMLIGESGVGKSSITTRYLDDDFDMNYLSTIGVDFRIITLNLNGKITKLQVWDTAGQERYRTITNSYYRGADGIILVFDLTNYESFHNISIWLNDIQHHCLDNVQLILVGNKSDLVSSRAISKDEIEEFSRFHHMVYFETSAKEDQNIQECFIELASKCTRDSEYLLRRRNHQPKLILGSGNKTTKQNCCPIR